VAGEGLKQGLFGHLDAGEQGVGDIVQLIARGRGGDGAGERVGHRQNIAREAVDGVLARLLGLALAAAAGVFHLGQGAQQVFAGLRQLGLEGGVRVGDGFGFGSVLSVGLGLGIVSITAGTNCP
jgi:hypothetical protein